MTREELIQKLSSLEWEDFEVKAAKSELPKSVWETVSAFSNTSGGWIILGVTEKGKDFEITGVGNAEKLEQDFLNTLRGAKFNVFVGTKQELYQFEDKTVLAFYVPVHKNKPVYFNNQGNTFIRRGSADQRATQEEIDSMLRDRAFGTKTAELAQGTSRDSLSNTSLNRYRDYMARFNPNASYNRFDEAEFLEKLRIMENGKCTYAGLLMFGKRDVIEKHFPDFRVDLLEVPSTSYSDAKQRYTFRIEEQENLWEYYFECFARLKQKVDVQFSLTAEGFGQELSPGLESIREALVNMLMHTDYFSPACPRVRIFTNHIEFYNPGGLPKPFEELKSKDISLPRNPILAKLFRMVKLAENAGFGFDKIDENWKAYNSTTPDYQIEFDSVVVGFKMEADVLKKEKPQQELKAWQQELQQEYKDYINQGLEQEQQELKQELQQELQQESQQESLYGKILGLLLVGALSTQEVSIALGQKSISGQLYTVINKLREDALIAWTIPETPKSPNQKYKLTKKGLAFYIMVFDKEVQ